ncbi:MAG: dihydroorotate dehydrogenase [Clostridia bacterium]|jgi:dihydroorotate dehydrogenase (NAD+) catalytic subunit|nr:dihydroorotate dehydrogenase [Clostridia bacterium]
MNTSFAKEPDLGVEIAGIKMKNPVMTASGTFGFGELYTDFFPLDQLGAVVVKGVTREARAGNPPPRLVETPSGLLNAIGLENPGVDKVIAEYLPPLAGCGAPVIVNIAGNTAEDYCYVAEKLSECPVVSGLEINISCPNVKAGGLAFGSRADLASDVVRQIRAATALPLIVKLSPNVTDIVEIALAVEEAGADALTLVNTLLGMAIDIKKRKPRLANITGGLSGPAMKPVALRMVWQVSQQVKIPVIGLGGIVTAADALEFIMAGASAVAIGTGQFINPCCCVEVAEGLNAYCLTHGIKRISDLIGVAWKE